MIQYHKRLIFDKFLPFICMDTVTCMYELSCICKVPNIQQNLENHVKNYTIYRNCKSVKLSIIELDIDDLRMSIYVEVKVTLLEFH